MEHTGTRGEEIRIQGLLERYLKQRTSGSNAPENHLDDDSLTAFVEGNLSEREAKPVVSHLVDCSFCLNVTAELVKLDYAFAGETLEAHGTENQPSKISEVLNGFLARIFGTSDGVVFAHHETEEPNKEEEKKEEK